MSEEDVPTLAPQARQDETVPAQERGDGSRPTAQPYEGERRPIPARGDRIGSFVVQRKLGAGAMGIVLLAVDPELDRQVAIKVLTSGVSEAAAQARFIREARSAARLQHPNVVTVYQVGTHEGQVYLVMEYVDGGTLRQWSESRERPWREVLEVFRQAGAGLAAAHAADLVHRDFKPDNVLNDRAGRARVSDFGLVGTAGETVEALTTEPDLDVTDRLTRTGAVMGTPAYMSPEQMAGAQLDARSDQFSFCVALYEALWGQRPFAGDTVATLAAALQRDARKPPRSDVPTRVTDALMRGLSIDPVDRYPDMNALLRALAPKPRRAYAAVVAITSATALAIGVASALVFGDEEVGASFRCPPATDELGGVGTVDTRESLRSAFAASGHPRAEETFERLQDELEASVSGWVDTYEEACDAVTRRGGRSVSSSSVALASGRCATSSRASSKRWSMGPMQRWSMGRCRLHDRCAIR